jgi:hypothetical protein
MQHNRFSFDTNECLLYTFIYVFVTYTVSEEEFVKCWCVPYVKVYRYNPKHLYPKLKLFVDNGQRYLKFRQLLHTYWLINTYNYWQEFLVSEILIIFHEIKYCTSDNKSLHLTTKDLTLMLQSILGFPRNVYGACLGSSMEVCLNSLIAHFGKSLLHKCSKIQDQL